MSTVESAASLFGSDGDAGPDPFAAIGNEDTDTTPPFGSNFEQQQTKHAQYDSSSYPADMGQDTSSLFAEQMYPDAQVSQQDPWSIPTNQDNSASQSNIARAPYDQHQSWYTDARSTGYEPLSTHASQPAARNAFTNDYDPYKPSPATPHHPAASAEQAYVQTSYNPYKPTSANTYAPQQAKAPPPVPIAHDSYKPISRSVSSPYAPTTAAAPPPLPSQSTTPTAVPTAASYRPKTSNAYDPPLPPPKVSRRAVSARASHSVLSAVGNQSHPVHGQHPLPPPPVPPLSPPGGHAMYGSLSTTSAPPPRPPSGPPPQRQMAQSYGAMEHTAPAGDQVIHQHPAFSTQASNGLSPELRELPGPPQMPPPARTPALPNKYTPNPSQATSSMDGAEVPPTHQHTSSNLPDYSIPATPRGHVITGQEQEQLPEVQAVYTSDDIPWDDPEGGYESGISKNEPVSLGEFSATSMNDFLPRQSTSTPPPPLKAASPEIVPVPSSTGTDELVHPSNSPTVSPPRGKAHHRHSTIVPNGRASPKSSSIHARVGSSGSNASPVRKPGDRVSSPLRNAVEANGHDVYTATVNEKTIHPYDPSPYAPLQRTSSPASVHSLNNQQNNPPSHYGLASHHVNINSYDSKPMGGSGRAMSPSSLRSLCPAADPYAPAKTVVAHTISQVRVRSGSNGSVLSSSSLTGDILHQRNEYGHEHKSYVAESSSYASVPAYSIGQEVATARPPYAPSPSLLGSNDPLGRVSARAPIISFGCGGKLITCFHGSSDLSTGFDVALSVRRTTNVAIRELYKILPEYALEPKAALYPGPLFSDPGSPMTSLVRTGMSSNTKSKKARVVKYLQERAEEMSRGTTYISDSTERRRVEDKLVLVQLLKIMVENDGVLYGSAQIDLAVRAALVPRIAGDLSESANDASASLPTTTFTSPMSNTFGATSSLSAGNEAPVSVTATLPSALDKIQEFLVRGQRRQAYHFALDEKLWAHAMIIASSIDKEAWKEVVSEFLKVELGTGDASSHNLVPRARDDLPLHTNGRDWLRVVYGLFAGQGPAASETFTLPVVPMTYRLQVPAPTLSHITPVSPNFPSVAVAAQVPVESLWNWAEIVASILSNASNPEWSAALTALGDYLLSHQQVEAAHVCYMLSPQTSMVGGVGSSSARIVLVGSQSPHSKPTFARDFDTIIFSEILEFALSLKPTPKGQETFCGFPHLQAYKLIRAAYLAEIGLVQGASRYCEAITASMARPSPYFNVVMVDQLKTLADRLMGTPHIDKSGSWISGKVNKPSLDSIGSWLEGRLTKFIAGEGDEPSQTTNSQRPAFSGPFSSSSVPSATTSASPSPPPPATIHSQFTPRPPRRAGSAMSLPSTQVHVPIDRSSSAMEYYRPARNASPAPPKTAPLQSAYPFSPYTPQANGHATPHAYVPAYGSNASSRKSSLEITSEEVANAPTPSQKHGPQQPKENGGWWNALDSADSAPTPTATTFHKVENVRSSADGLISLMDDPALSVSPSPGAPPRRLETTFEDEEDDLGLGNSAPKKPEDKSQPAQGQSSSPTAQEQAIKSEEKPESQPASQATSGGSWFSRFWKRSETPGPIRANLGEETSFYYDNELKRWVNKKAGAEAAQPSAPPPPPSRAQTASPTHAARRLPTGGPGGPPLAPPIARIPSAIDLTTAKPPLRSRSNLAPQGVNSMPTTPLPGSGRGTEIAMPPPSPMGRPRSQAAKKNVRSRYVDVFQQEASASAA
ncbi:hypothetical protein ID866_1463 [Astraeus odoratus]|nr:hypothetical protein ID866_1463 [Astraeus odoratus]